MKWFSGFRKKQISHTSIDFNGFGSLMPNWVNLNSKLNYLDAYYNIPELNAVINYLASAFSKAKFKLVKQQRNGLEKPIENHHLLDLLNSPNVLQSQKEWLIQLYTYWQVLGNANILGVSPAGFGLKNIDQVKSLWNLPTQYIEYDLTGKLYLAEDIKEIIDKVWINYNIRKQLPVENLIFLNDSNIKYAGGEYVIGESKIKALQKPISNLCANYTARNVLLNKRGALGILTNESVDGQGSLLPLRPDEKATIQNDFQNYGLSHDQWQVIITNANLKWQQMALPVKDLMLDEQLKRDKIAICDSYMLNILLLSESEGSTFSNVKEAKKQLYIDKIIPDWQMFESELNKAFNLQEQGLKLKIIYDHIEVLQSDKKLEAERNKLNIETILSIQKSINEGSTSLESGIEMLMQIIGITEENAIKLLIRNEINEINENEENKSIDLKKYYTDKLKLYQNG